MASTPLPLTTSRAEQIFPVLTPAQIARIAPHGRTHAVKSGEVQVEQGDSALTGDALSAVSTTRTVPCAVVQRSRRTVAVINYQIPWSDYERKQSVLYLGETTRKDRSDTVHSGGGITLNWKISGRA